ncbi:MAG TPA: endolytic transglycosylase MltG [Rhodospirillaceae bacterium]|nr:endolytic transglycosylase MltG [Rhodospirillaceae bacterium]
MKRWLVRLVVAVVLAAAVAGGGVLWVNHRIAMPGPLLEQTSVVITKGMNTQAIAGLLQESGVIEQSWPFLASHWLSGRHPLQAGEYAFPEHASMASVIDMMRRGQVVVHKITVAEGLTVFQVMAQMRQVKGLSGNPTIPPDEGSLLPQTYRYSVGDSRDSVLTRMAQAMNDSLDALWPKRAANLPLTNKIDALVLASIVERETAIAEERPHVAAVFLNRLTKHMKLQSDPTVIYAVSNGEGVLDRPLSQKDLAAPSPFNTYLVEGLPPGPICNPGEASLAAVLHPADSADLYFVADHSGGHVFAKTLAEHNHNVARLRQMEQGQLPSPTEKKVKSAR